MAYTITTPAPHASPRLGYGTSRVVATTGQERSRVPGRCTWCSIDGALATLSPAVILFGWFVVCGVCGVCGVCVVFVRFDFVANLGEFVRDNCE